MLASDGIKTSVITAQVTPCLAVKGKSTGLALLIGCTFTMANRRLAEKYIAIDLICYFTGGLVKLLIESEDWTKQQIFLGRVK